MKKLSNGIKKLFGGINLTWKKLIIFAIVTAIYTAIMAIIPATYETSFRDIAIYIEWWVLFGVIIIVNSKSPLDSGLKCFVFFLISQPLIYLIQVPFSSMGWGLFSFYKYWFMWTLACFPMGFIGYYIKKKNIISLLILLPILGLVAFMGLGYFSSVIYNFPHHLLSCIFCFTLILVIIFNIFDKIKLRILSIAIVIMGVTGYLIYNNVINAEYETYRTLDQYNITFDGEINVTYFAGTEDGDAQIVSQSNPTSVKLRCRKNGKYKFTITDSSDKEYNFEFHYDEKEDTVILTRTDNK